MRSIYVRAIFSLTFMCAAWFAAPAPVKGVTPTGVYPLLDCVTYDAPDNIVTAIFGYVSTNSDTVLIPVGPDNKFTSDPADRGQSIFFFPGTNHDAFEVTFSLSNTPQITWSLLGHTVTASNNPALYCSSGAFTYQGRLTDGGTPANGTYDLQFQLFPGITNTSNLGTIQLEDVQVTNGVFTVQLNFTSNQLSQGPYLEVGVRPGAQTGAYTILSPRQVITTAPYAMTSAYAIKAGDSSTLGGISAGDYVTRFNLGTSGSPSFIVNGTSQQTANFNISGNGTVGGAFTANTVSANSSTNLVVNAQSSSTIGTWFRLQNTSTGGHNWNLISTGSGNGEGAGKLIFNDQTAANTAMTIEPNGNITIAGTLAVTTLGSAGSTSLCLNSLNQISSCSSSLRYKTNVAPFSFGLNLISRLRPISFDWKTGGMRDVGFGAEDVAAINPLFVTYNARGEVEGVKYDRLSVVFVNAFKEQQAQIEQQQNQLKNQQNQIDALKKLVCLDHPNTDVCK
ncbi:MAG: tail fiber domain-containing protein [Pyrinomonadaceae bacterium]